MSNTSTRTQFADEPLIVPFTPGEVLVRLSQVRGALPEAQHAFSARLDDARSALHAALEQRVPSTTAAAFEAAQQVLCELYDEVQDDNGALEVLGFPSPAQRSDAFALQAPDPASVLTTYVLNGKQVLTSISFDRSTGATAYWLHIVRYWQEAGETQRIEDPVVENYAPLFSRVKLPPGKQILRIKARNASTSAISDEFEIDVPDLNTAK